MALALRELDFFSLPLVKEADARGRGAAEEAVVAADAAQMFFADRLRVAIVGAGPAGTVCAMFLLFYARRLARDVEVVLFDRKVFTEFGPKGCNLCAGVISHTLVRNLAALDVTIPPAAIQQEVTGYHMESRAGGIHLAKPPGSTIYTVYRGIGPRSLEYDEARSFDQLLLTCAVQRGAQYVNALVSDIRLPTDPTAPVEVLYGDGKRYLADVVVAAFGLHSSLGRRLEDLGFGYRSPESIQACQAEIPLDEAFIREAFRGQIKIFNLGLPRIRFAALTPKQRHVTVSVIGKQVNRRDLEGFLHHPRVRCHFPPGWQVPADYCCCYPRLPVTAARRPFAERLVLIGDADISRYLKDGIGSACHTAMLAARTILHAGLGREAFRRYYYRPARRKYAWDNLAGKILFRYNDLISRVPLLAAAHLRLAQREQRGPPGRPRPFNDLLWYMFTGDSPYLATLRKGMSPGLWGRLPGEVLRAFFHRLANGWTIAPEER